MACEILAVPEDNLEETIKVIRAGLRFLAASNDPVSEDTVEGLTNWCAKEEEYLAVLAE